MAAHFDLAGLSIERFYHFVCKADQPTFDLMAELGIARQDALGARPRWATSSTARLHPWGDPVSLLSFPQLTLVEKIRYGAMMFFSTRRNDWRRLENVLGQGLDRRLVRRARLRQALGAAVRSEVLRICRQHLGRLDLDPHPPRRQLPPLADAGGARLYRGRLGDAGRGAGARRSTRQGGRCILARRPVTRDRDRGRTGDRRRAPASGCSPPMR